MRGMHDDCGGHGNWCDECWAGILDSHPDWRPALEQHGRGLFDVLVVVQNDIGDYTADLLVRSVGH